MEMRLLFAVLRELILDVLWHGSHVELLEPLDLQVRYYLTPSRPSFILVKNGKPLEAPTG